LYHSKTKKSVLTALFVLFIFPKAIFIFGRIFISTYEEKFRCYFLK